MQHNVHVYTSRMRCLKSFLILADERLLQQTKLGLWSKPGSVGFQILRITPNELGRSTDR